MRRWALHAPSNFLAKQFLLEAELARVQGDHLEAFAKYSSAVLHAGGGKFLMLEALANERAARLYLERKDTTHAIEYFTTAVQLYNRWGGKAKVEHLVDEVKGMLDVDISS